MPSYTNTLRAVSRRGQWRFRQVFRATRADGRLDLTDAGLVDFSSASDLVLTVTPRRPVRLGAWGAISDVWCDAAGCEPAPVLSAALSDGSLTSPGPGLVEAVFPAGTLLGIPPGLYDVRLAITIGAESTEMFDEPIEFA